MTIENFIPFALPDMDELELEAVRRVIESGWITTGPETMRFEAEFASRVGAKHGIAVNSCTAAMHLALEAVGLGPGDEVITTPYTFAATAEVVRYFDAKPVFVDVDPCTLNIRADKIEEACTDRTRAILPVHVAGLPAQMDEILGLARHLNLLVIEDAAHAFPASFRGQPVGSLSDLTCFSFYATKTITTGEGGMITTDNDRWAERCRVMALHGIGRDAWKRYSAEGSWFYEITAPGYKYNLTDIASAIGRVQLEKAERMRGRRAEIRSRYDQAFSDHPGLEVPKESAESEHAWHLYMLRLNLSKLTIDRREFIRILREKNVGASVHFIPLHIHPYYRTTYGFSPGDFPVAFREFQREISLPIYSRMSDLEAEQVAGVVIDIAEGNLK